MNEFLHNLNNLQVSYEKLEGRLATKSEECNRAYKDLYEVKALLDRGQIDQAKVVLSKYTQG